MLDSVATPRTVDNAIRNNCDKAMMPRKSSHDLRRTFATNFSYSGTSTKTIQGWMGHETLSQTEAYICTKLATQTDINEIEKTAGLTKGKQQGKQVI